jgi:cellulose synthase/poly-beta-1,6-N-acetylglucosamine synthase-like glycosyltransferase
LTVAGFFHMLASAREKEQIDRTTLDLPRVAILIPAHNEARVMTDTLTAMLALEYPAERYEVIVVDDGSTDGTGALVRGFAERDARVRLVSVAPGEGGRGKSRALNIGLSHTDAPFIAVYDADNSPEPPALRYLMAQLVLHPQLGAVLGKFRTDNWSRNLLTRFISVETLTFQSIVQAGRWKLFGVSTLPGTNFVIWRSLLKEVGGWDEKALTEDAELTIRLYETGRRIRFVPSAVTWEQEPEQLRVWLRQRLRWARGHNYVLAKHAKRLLTLRPRVIALELLYTLLLYYVVCAAILISDSLAKRMCLHG